MTSDDRADYRLTFVVLAVGLTAYSLLQSMVSPLLPLLQRDLHTTQNTVTWVLTAYLLSASVATPILGRLADKYGKEKMLLVTLAALGIGSVLGALATSIGVMIIARVVQGVGGGIMPIAFGIVRDEFPREKIAGVVGILAALLAVGGGVGIALAGPIESSLSYHWLFWIPGIIVAITFVMTFLFIPESPIRTPGKISFGAAFLLSAWLICILLGFSEVPSWGWGSWKVLALFAAGIVLAVAWVRAELRARTPLIDMRMMQLKAVWTTNLAAFLIGVGMYTMYAFLPEFLQTPKMAGYGFGASITESGLWLLPQAAVMFVAGSYSGPLSARIGGKGVMLCAAAVGTAGFLVMAVAHGGLAEVIFASCLLGVSFGFGFSAMTTLIVEAVPPSQTGVASGMNANIRTVGGAIGAAVISSVVTSHLQDNGLPKESGYTLSFVILGVCMVLAGVAALMIPRLGRHEDAHTIEQLEMAHPAMAVVPAGTVVGDESE
jgi:EmrB/QacA subfamily drug resistance transporter